MIFATIPGSIKTIVFIDQHSAKKLIFSSSFASGMSSEDLNKSADNFRFALIYLLRKCSIENFKIFKISFSEMCFLYGPVIHFFQHHRISFALHHSQQHKVIQPQMILNWFLINSKRISNIHTEYDRCSTIFLKLDTIQLTSHQRIVVTP